MKLASFMTLILLLTSNITTAQNPAKLYKRGIEAFYKEDFEAASVFFQEIENTGRSYKDSEYRLEIANLIQPKYRERSLDKMIKFYEFKPKSDKFFYYWIGRIYANRYMFPEAVEAWNKFLNRSGYKSDEIVSETNQYIAKAAELVSYFDNPDNYEIHQLDGPINTEYAELTPVYSEEKDELLFASNRENTKDDQFKIYHAEGNDHGWSAPTSLDVLGTFDRNEANVEVVNEDGKLFIFRDVHKGDLFYSEPSRTGWNQPVEFDSEITSTHLESHFYINEHEDRIIFATRNKNTGLDLMESFRNAETGEWEKPHPFGLTINSEFNEDSPFLSHDETKFYFLSDRPGGVGGYDVYVSTLDQATNLWTDPVNMGWPINSPDDEMHFKMNADGSSGYFSSNRIHSKGDYDIFFFWSIEKTKIRGRVINALTQEPVTEGEIRFHPSQYLDEYFRSPLDSSGRYGTDIISNENFRVEVISQIDTLMTESFEIHDSKGESITHYKDFYVIPKDLSDEERLALEKKYKSKPEIIQTDMTVAANTEVEDESQKPKESVTAKVTSPKPDTESADSYGKPLFVGNIYFEFGTSTITEASLPRLNEILDFLVSNPGNEIEIAGHTDNIGNERMNQIISKNRALAAKRWLVENGIASSRIAAVGYGSKKPMASNDDEINGRSLNRRIEVLVVN